MIYSIRHTTTFRYQPEIRESVMEVRMQPRNETEQRCLTFQLDISPTANIMQYTDFTGNIVHHFDIAGRHSEVKVIAHSTVEVQYSPPPNAADAGDWADLDAAVATDDYWDMLGHSDRVQTSELLDQFAAAVNCVRRGNPLELLTEINEAIYTSFAYVKNSTNVDSHIDDALRTRKGVCQDFAHIMIALVRSLKIPCRYVSGYMYHRDASAEKKDRSLEGASHAWVEALVPRLGWVAFDPTNNLVGSDRHIRVAIGRDYGDVPPTRGVYKGEAESGLSVNVVVSPSEIPAPTQLAPAIVMQARPVLQRNARIDQEQQQQQ
jgi:transglutaminase-like putative cysteine protease